MKQNEKSNPIAYALLIIPAFFTLGGLALHDFYLNRILFGVIKIGSWLLGSFLIGVGTGISSADPSLTPFGLLFIFGGFVFAAVPFFWNLVDLFLIPKLTSELNAKNKVLGD